MHKSMNHISLTKKGRTNKVTHCAVRLLANSRHHQLRWGDWEMHEDC